MVSEHHLLLGRLCENTLRSLMWTHDKLEFKLLPRAGSPFRPGVDPQVKNWGDELTQGPSQGVVITFVNDLLIAGWQHHIGATEGLPHKRLWTGWKE